MNVKENTELVFREVAEASLSAHRESGSVSVIAVTKYVDVPTAEALLPLGVHHIGENRVDKFLEKYEALKDRDVTWHLIGTLDLQREIQEKQIPNMPMTELSMGMSRDYKEAIQFGSTFVRIGTSFFK